MNKVRIQHEETNLETEVVASSVPVWVSHGWTVVEDEDNQKPAPVTRPKQPMVPRTNGAPAAPDASKEE